MWLKNKLIKQYQAPETLLYSNNKDQTKRSLSYVKIMCVRYDLIQYIKNQLKIPIFISIKLMRMIVY